MSYSLSFSPEFFFAEGEPYDGGPEPSHRPVSVWHAIESMRVLWPERWNLMARELFKCEPQFLTAETVHDAIRETDTCSNLDCPVSVWIDREGWWTVEVYE